VSRRLQWLVAAAGLTALTIAILSGPELEPVVDHFVYERTIQRMQDGEGYYPAMDASLREYIGPAATLRAFREPTAFWWWTATNTYRRPFAIALAILCGVLVGHLTSPMWALAVGGWLLVSTNTFSHQLWGYVHVWAIPLVLLTFWAARRDRWTLAALAAFVTAIVMELAVLLLVGGLVGAIRGDEDHRPWLIAIGAWVAFVAWHVANVTPFLEPSGDEAPLIGTGNLVAVVIMAGPHTGLGFLIAVYVLITRRFHPLWWLCAPVIALIPLSGLIVERGYWGYLVLPLAVCLLGVPATAPLPAPRRPEPT
jgi:hypothetical protein